MLKFFNRNNEFDKNKLICSVNSLEQFGLIKNRLNQNNIIFFEKISGKQHILLFIYQIFFIIRQCMD